MTDPQTDAVTGQRMADYRTYTHVIYGLFAGGMLCFPLFFVGVIMAYVRRPDVEGTWLAPHYRWLIRTFWGGLALVVLGWVLAIVLVGFLVLFAAWLWGLYRLVKGWTRLRDGRPA